jgi:hypothetical protein
MRCLLQVLASFGCQKMETAQQAAYTCHKQQEAACRQPRAGCWTLPTGSTTALAYSKYSSVTSLILV